MYQPPITPPSTPITNAPQTPLTQAKEDRRPRPEDYIETLKAEAEFAGLSDEDAKEYLQIIYDIMWGFVKIGHGLEPVQKLINDFEKPAKPRSDLLYSKDAQDEK